MKVGWIVDAQAFDTYHDELIEAIVRNGHLAVSVERPPAPYQWDDVDCSYRKCFPAGACVVTHGDVDLVNRVSNDGLWSPGVFAEVKRYHCSHYFAHFGDVILNHDYVMLPFAEFPRLADSLFGYLGVEGELFVRPDSPMKVFNGQRIAQSEFDKDYEFMAFNEFPREALIVVSSPKNIATEWRFVVVEKRIVAGTEYHNGSEFVAYPVAENNALQFAQRVAARVYQPEPVWILDICRTTEGEYRVVEVGGFSFASLYGCDKDAVVNAVSDAAKAIHARQAR